MLLSALIVAKNEDIFIEECIERILPYVDEIVFVDNCSTDKTLEIVQNIKSEKIKILSFPETSDMGAIRQFSLDNAQGDWIWQIDADEFYTQEACEKILEAIKNAKEEISFRVGYYNLSWKKDCIQAKFQHFPDRLYRRDTIDRYDGILPNDMTKVKKEFYTYRPFLEYDNINDKSIVNRKQPILPVFYWHMARSRGFNFEYNKWKNYNKNINPSINDIENDRLTRINQWVSGFYPLQRMEISVRQNNIKNPKVSVIIPCYNYGKYVSECIESVKNQTYKNIEIIVVNDGSKDESDDILSKIEGITYMKQENQGVSWARNNGAKKATGDFLIFLDADDVIDRTYIEKTLSKQQETNADIVSTDMEFFGEQTGIHSYPQHSKDRMLEGQNVPSTCALVKHQAHISVGGFNPVAHYEDWAYWLEMYKKEMIFEKVNEPLFKYRKHGYSRIDLLDEKQEEGFAFLRNHYGIKR